MKNKMKLMVVLLLGVVIGLYADPSYSHGGAGFKPKFEKITLDDATINAIKLKTQKIEHEDIYEIVKSTGQIEEIPNNHFNINSPVQGTVVSVLVNLGSKVGVGTSVATIESSEISSLQSDIYKLRAEKEYATNNFEREESLFKDGISAKKDFEASKAQLKSAEAKLRAAEGNLRILTGLTAESANGKFNITSRKNGTIVERNITVGEVVSPTKLLFHGIDLSSVWASANIYEKDIEKVSLNQVAYVTLDSLPNKVFQGKIEYIGSVLVEKSRTLPVKVKLDNLKGELKPGAFTTIKIHTKNKKKSIVIPITALVDIEADKNIESDIHKHIVYIKEANDFVPKEVEVALHDSNTVEVLSGLKLEDEVVISGGYQLQFAEGGHDEHEGHEGHDHDNESDNHEGHNHDDHEVQDHDEEHDHKAHKKQVKSSSLINNKFSSYILMFVILILGIILGVFFGRKKQ